MLAARGEPIGFEEVLIGATAMVRGLPDPVVTRNRRHFDRIDGLRVESWWRHDPGGGIRVSER